MSHDLSYLEILDFDHEDELHELELIAAEKYAEEFPNHKWRPGDRFFDRLDMQTQIHRWSNLQTHMVMNGWKATELLYLPTAQAYMRSKSWPIGWVVSCNIDTGEFSIVEIDHGTWILSDKMLLGAVITAFVQATEVSNG